MAPIKYHQGQREVQSEANCLKVADSLADWVGPVTEYARGADFIILSYLNQEQILNFAVLSGSPPLITVTTQGSEIVLGFPGELLNKIPAGTLCGGIIFNLAQARRSRIGGVLTDNGAQAEMRCNIALTHCRKYIARSTSLGSNLNIGPDSVETLSLDDPMISDVLARAETSFLATTTPEGVPDTSHRGGQPGFLHYLPQTRQISWTEFLGDGMFLSLGNIRATGRFSLLVLDITTGDALVLRGEGAYTNIRTSRHERIDALIQDKEAYSVQGRMSGQITAASRIINICHPRQPIEQVLKVTACSSVDEQAPN